MTDSPPSYALPIGNFRRASNADLVGLQPIKSAQSWIAGTTTNPVPPGLRRPSTFARLQEKSSALPEDTTRRVKGLVDELEKVSRNKTLYSALEKSFKDLHETCRTMEQTKNYEVQSTTLGQWASHIRSTLKMMENDAREWVVQVGGQGGEMPSSFSEVMLGSNALPNSMSFSVAPTANKAQRRGSSTSALPALPVNGDPSIQQYQPTLAAALYYQLESVMIHLNAERAVLLQYTARTDELRSICISGSGTKMPFRVAAQSGIEGGVFQTGVALNLASAYGDTSYSGYVDHKTGFRTHNMLCFPLMTSGGISTRKPFGLIQVMNKCKGTVSFDTADEASLHVHAAALSYLVQHYPIDFINFAYDPSPFHSTVPLELAGPRASLLPIESKEPRQLIYRSSHSGNIRRQRISVSDATPITGVASLMEVDDYIAHMEEAWRKAVLLNMEQEKEITVLSKKLHGVSEEMAQLRLQCQEIKAQVDALQAENQVLKHAVSTHQTSNALHDTGVGGQRHLRIGGNVRKLSAIMDSGATLTSPRISGSPMHSGTSAGALVPRPPSTVRQHSSLSFS